MSLLERLDDAAARGVGRPGGSSSTGARGPDMSLSERRCCGETATDVTPTGNMAQDAVPALSNRRQLLRDPAPGRFHNRPFTVVNRRRESRRRTIDARRRSCGGSGYLQSAHAPECVGSCSNVSVGPIRSPGILVSTKHAGGLRNGGDGSRRAPL